MQFDSEQQKQFVLKMLEGVTVQGRDVAALYVQTVDAAAAGAVVEPQGEQRVLGGGAGDVATRPLSSEDLPPRPEVSAAMNGGAMGSHGVAEGARVEATFDGEEGG